MANQVEGEEGGIRSNPDDKVGFCMHACLCVCVWVSFARMKSDFPDERVHYSDLVVFRESIVKQVCTR